MNSDERNQAGNTPTSAPKTGTGSGPVRDTFDDRNGEFSRGSHVDLQHTQATMAAFDGTGAELVNQDNTEGGDRITHRVKGVGTIVKVGKLGQPHTIEFDSGETGMSFGHHMVHGEHSARTA